MSAMSNTCAGPERGAGPPALTFQNDFLRNDFFTRKFYPLLQTPLQKLTSKKKKKNPQSILLQAMQNIRTYDEKYLYTVAIY